MGMMGTNDGDFSTSNRCPELLLVHQMKPFLTSAVTRSGLGHPHGSVSAIALIPMPGPSHLELYMP